MRILYHLVLIVSVSISIPVCADELVESKSAEQKVLKRFIGNWAGRTTLVTPARGEVEDCGLGSWIFNGKVLHFTAHYARGDEEIDFLSYDEHRRSYRLAWVNSNGAMNSATGNWDEAKKTFTWTFDRQNDQDAITATWHFVDDDTFEWQASALHDGKVIEQAKGREVRVRSGTGNAEALDLYLRGQQAWNKRTPADIEHGIKYFQQAIEKDPKYAMAYAGLASCYATLPDYGEVPLADVLTTARAAAKRALELNPQLAEAQSVLGYCWSLEGNRVEAEKAFGQAFELNSGYATAHQWYSGELARAGKMEEALAELYRARTIDPHSDVVQCNLALFLNRAGKKEEALRELEEVLKRSPGFAMAYTIRSTLRIREKNYNQAISDLEKARSLGGNISRIVGLLGYCYAVTGRTADAREMLDLLKAKQAKGLKVSIGIAGIYEGLGDEEQAFKALEQAAADHEPVAALKYWPGWEKIAADPRFSALLEKYGQDR